MRQIDPAALSPGEFRSSDSESRQTGRRETRRHRQSQRVSRLDAEERFLTVQMHELLTFLNRQALSRSGYGAARVFG
jgi:hypothetical protein